MLEPMRRLAQGIVRLLVSVGAITVAVVTLHDAGAAFGTMPDCGNGTYFLYPAPVMLRMIVTSVGVSVVAAIVIVIAGPGRRWLLLAALVLTATLAAATGAAWSEALHGCGVEGDSHVPFAAGATAVISTLVAAVVGGAWAAMHPPRRPMGAPPTLPPGSRALGEYRVHHSVVDGVTAGEHVWLALTEQLLLVLHTDGLAGTIDRYGLSVTARDGMATLSSNGWPLMDLEALPATDPAELVATLGSPAA